MIRRHTDSKAESSLCRRPRHTVALVVVSSLSITSVAGKVSLFVVDSWLQHQVPLFAVEEVATTAFAASQTGGPTVYLPKCNRILLGTRIQSDGTPSLPEAIVTELF